jgi:CheY-like chemotaxis protein
MNNKSVLVIDDDEISLLIVQNALEMEGYTVMTTTDSLLAAELLKQHKPDVVVLDIFMPGKDGFELIKELRSLCADTFIIAISANDQCLRTIKLLGANVAISKLNMPDVIVDSIKEWHGSLTEVAD